MVTGTYVLLIELAFDCELTIGALGERQLAAGWYAYVGSAFGPGGFSRIDRHRRVATEGIDRPHWHIDYLLERGELVDSYRAPDRRIECHTARQLPGTLIDGVGASDCSCDSHLRYSPDERTFRTALETHLQAFSPE